MSSAVTTQPTTSERVQARRMVSNFLRSLPWYTDAPFQEELLYEQATQAGTLGFQMQSFIAHVKHLENSIISRADIKATSLNNYLGISPPNSGLEALRQWSAHEGNNLCLMYTAYRIIDACAMLDGRPHVPSARPRWTSIQTPVTFKKLLKWPEIIKTFGQLTAQRQKYRLIAPAGPAHVRIFKQLASLHVTGKYQNILGNFLHAALHLAYMRDTNFNTSEIPDYPNSTHEYRVMFPQADLDESEIAFMHELLDGTPQEGRSVQNDGTGAKDRTRIQYALQAAMCVSPMALLIPADLSVSQLSRSKMLKYALALGSNKPQIVLDIEKAIFECLFTISLAENDTQDELRRLNDKLSTMGWQSVSPEIASWFDASSVPALHMQSSSSQITEVPSHTATNSPTAALAAEQAATTIQESHEGAIPRERPLAQERTAGENFPTEVDDDTVTTTNANARPRPPPAQSPQVDIDMDDNTGMATPSRPPPGPETTQVDIDLHNNSARGTPPPPARVDIDMNENVTRSPNEQGSDSHEARSDPKEIKTVDAGNGTTSHTPPPLSAQMDVDMEDNAVVSPKEQGADRNEARSDDEELSESSDSDANGDDDEGVSARDADETTRARRVPKEKSSSPRKSTRLSTKPDRKNLYMVASGKSAGQKRKRAGEGAGPANPIDVDAHWEDMHRNQFLEVKPALEVGTKPKRYPQEKPVVAYGPTGKKYSFKAYYHFPVVGESHRSFMNAVESRYIKGRPPHVATPDSSCIAVISEEEYNKLSAEDAQEMFSGRHIVLTNCRSTSPGLEFDEAGLRTLRHLHAPIAIQDCSVPPDSDSDERTQIGTVQDLLASARDPHGKILNALNFPSWKMQNADSQIGTDMVAWEFTIGQNGCQDPQYPSASVHWGLANTANAFTTTHIDCSGFATFIEVLTGAKVWYLCTPVESQTDITWLSELDIDTARETDQWEAVVLTPGDRLLMRPNTLHAVYSPQPSICQGGHFYCTSTMADTLAGMVHCFVRGYDITNSNLTSSSLLLRRIALFYYRALVDNISVSSTPDADHLPNLTRIDGVIQLLSLCNMVILANVLDARTYRAPNQPEHRTATDLERLRLDKFDHNSIPVLERRHMCQARGICLQILDWFTANYQVRDERCSPLEQVDFAHRYFASQCAVLKRYKSETAKDPESMVCTPALCERQIKNVLGLYKRADDYYQALDDNPPHDLGLGVSIAFLDVTQREKPLPFQAAAESDWINLGTTPLDTAYFEGFEVRAEMINSRLAEEVRPKKIPRKNV